VIGDSRVQKEARSAAESGWDVVLLGRWSSASASKRWRIGGARVRLLEIPALALRHRRYLRSARSRDPLAYPTSQVAAKRQAELLGLKSEAQSKIAESAARPGAAGAAGKWLWRLRLRSVIWVQQPVAQARGARTIRVTKHRVAGDGRADKVATWWWDRLLGPGAWRRWDPALLAYEGVYGPVVDSLKPDIIHANDFKMLGVGARAVARARARGRDVRLVWDAHEFLPGIKPYNAEPQWHEAQIRHERQFAPYANAVVTVTEPLAELLTQEHSLPEKPAVVMNAPRAADVDTHVEVGLRAACGLPDGPPLLVYSGAAAAQRGLDTMVDALPALPDVHVAFVVMFPPNAFVRSMQKRAADLGVSDRLHVLPYVGVHEIVGFLRSATIGVIPAHKWPNHEISLGTKFFEYAFAGLPVIVSDLKAMSTVVEETGMGEVFQAKHVGDFIRAVQAILDDLEGYRDRCAEAVKSHPWTWEPQAEVLDEVYARLRADQVGVSPAG
jgi:glycosyltransferase involved in cell wall biosynthesis